MPIRLQYTSTTKQAYKVFNAETNFGKFIQRPKHSGRASLAVMPCLSHEKAVTVPVEVVVRAKGDTEFTVVGTGKACPFCWELLKKDF